MNPLFRFTPATPFIPLPSPANLAAVFSVRKAVAGYTGFCMNVRRSSDNATLNIGFIGNDLDIATAQNFAAGSTLFVTKWFDQSVSGFDASVATSGSGSQQPELIFGLNGKSPAVAFGGQSTGGSVFQFLSATSPLTLTGDQTLGAVADSYGSSLGYILHCFNSGSPFTGWSLGVGNTTGTTTTTSYWSSTKAAFINDTVNLYSRGAQRIAITRTGGSVQFYDNGVASGAAVTGGGNAASTQNLGVGGANSTLGHPGSTFNGCVYEAYAYSSALSASDLANLDRGQSLYFPQPFTAPISGAASVAFSGTSNPVTAQSITIGSHLTFERTQPWTAFSAVRAMAVPALASIIFTNVTTSPNFPGYEMWINQSGFLTVRIISNIVTPNFIGKFGSVNICDGKNHFVAASYDGSSTAAGVNLYVDGVLDTNPTVESDTLSASIVSGTQTFMVGNQPNHLDFWFKGIVDFFSLDNIVRNGAYVAAHSTPSSLPLNDGANTSLYLALNDDTGTTATDSSASGFNGTLSSASMWYPS